ncbi:unnamed protein product [Effrenium voratum]|uniref:ATP-dependent DNA helicase n=1 Tax=Effrenium voratum TaxID=2562239 RepID=A0AA36N7R2_9DINO|nr:unnamed protein product [Effrenium voratum]
MTAREKQLRLELKECKSLCESRRAALRLARQQLREAEQRQEELETELQALQRSHGDEDWVEQRPWTQDLRRICEDFFGVATFRRNQEEAMNAVLSGRDVVLVAPTGAGKSLCFQAPALLRKNLTLVVSPLLSLMQDQVMALRALGLKASMLSSGDSREEQTKVRAEMKEITSSSSAFLLYLTPERLAKSKLVMNLLEKIYAAGRLGLIAIDEAHCVSHWGHDFRPDYEKLAALRVQFPSTPILALTATATPAVAADLQRSLSLGSAVELRAPTDRPKLFYAVRHRPKGFPEVLELVAKTVQGFPRGTPGLVYCITRKEAEALQTALAPQVPCAFYHGDLDPMARHKVHSAWMEGEIHVVVATVAFGMGINKADVRFVIHCGLPASLHHYYQEAGRAGRDGKPALCLLLYRPSDVTRHSVMNYYKPASLRELYSAAMFCQRRTCRRAQIARHFGEEAPACPKACDVCEAEKEEPPCKRRRSETSSQVASGAWQKALELAVAARGKEELFTLTKLSDKLQKACKWKGDAAADDAMYVVMSLLGTGYLREEFRHSPYATNAYLVATERADKAVSGEVSQEAVDLGTPSALLRSAAPAPAMPSGGQTRPQHLQKLRAKLARQAQLPAQFILSDEELAQVAKVVWQEASRELWQTKTAWALVGLEISLEITLHVRGQSTFEKLYSKHPFTGHLVDPNGFGLGMPGEADESVAEDSAERLHQELSGVTPEGSPGCHCLEFDSWWNEGKQRRFVYIRYSITEGAFQMAIDEDSNLYHVPVAYGARTGEAVTVWDLHVGAEVDILGRMTTLQRCSQTTAEWNKYWAGRLTALRNRLAEELKKYDTRKFDPWLTWQKAKVEVGGNDLRLLMGQVAGLSAQLNEYRPRLAAQLSVPQEMLIIEDLPRKRRQAQEKEDG